jgi:hypothetical protein
MSRGSDPFEFDDLRDSDWGSNSSPESHTLDSFGFARQIGRGRDGNSSDLAAKRRLQDLRTAESESDRVVNSGQEARDIDAASGSRHGRAIGDLGQHDRSIYRENDRTYSLRPSQIYTFAQVGRFRVIHIEDLARFPYGDDRAFLENDLRNLLGQGLLERRKTGVFKKQSRQVLTLTKRGERLLRHTNILPKDQAIYSGLVKPREAEHDANLYRLYQRAASEIASKGGRVLRVQLDYELKEKLYRKVGRAQAEGRQKALSVKHEYAHQMHLPIVNGKVSFPDLRIEYADEHMQISRVDLELATGHYHAGHLAEKARAGFQIYARAEEAAGLRRVRDEREIMTSILSF